MQLCLLVFDFMVYPDPKVFIFKTKNRLMVEADFLVLCCHARHLQQIHQNENFCMMYGLAVIVSVVTLNICQILMK